MGRRRSVWAAVVAGAAGLTVALAPGAVALGDDPGLEQQWGMRQIGAPEAWKVAIGAGVPIAVIDTGIELAHEDLKDQVAAAVTCIDTNGDPRACRADGADIHGHGSHVAGIAAAASNGKGVSGVAPGARLIAIRVFKPSNDPVRGPGLTANTDDINAAIRWAVANSARKGVINLSLGDELPIALGSAGFEDGIEEAWKAGWATALAAGNEGDLLGLNSEGYGTLDALVVGATGPDGQVSDYSSPFGSAKWGLVAPGGNAQADGSTPACQNEPGKCVLSTYKGTAGSPNQYGFLQGTSMATPHVAGAVALLMGAGMSNAQAVDRILASTDRTIGCGAGCKGRLDVAKATAGLAPGPGSFGAGAAAPTTEATVPPPGASTGGQGGGSTGAAASPTTRPTARTVPPATSAPAPATGATEPPTSTEAPTPMPSPVDESGGDDVVGMSIEEAAAAADRGGGDDGPPAVLVIAAALALLGVAAPTAMAWRSRRIA